MAPFIPALSLLVWPAVCGQTQVALRGSGVQIEKRLYDLVSTDVPLSAAKLGEMRELLAAGVAPDGFTHPSYGDTTLIQASYENHGGAVDVLLEHGADPNAADYDGETALMLAAQRGFTAIAANLLAHGADVVLAEKKLGETALSRARFSGHKDIEALLRAATTQSERVGKAHARTRVAAVGGGSGSNCSDADREGHGVKPVSVSAPAGAPPTVADAGDEPAAAL